MSPRPRLTRPEYVGLVVAVIISYSYYFAWLDVPILHDAAGYLRAAKDIVSNGLFSKFDLSDLRTYAWPLVLSGFVRLSELTGISIRLLVFHFNLLFLLGSCLVLRQAFFTAGAPPRLARLAFLAVVLNPLVLIYTGYLMTESLSFSLIILLLAASVAIVSPARKDQFLLMAAAGSLLLGIAVMVRPGNLAMVPVWGLAVLLAVVRHRPKLPGLMAASGIAVVFLALPMAPQFLNNLRHYGRSTPLVANDFSQGGRWIGVRNIKYTTSHTGDNNPQVFYENPFYAGEPITFDTALGWYWQHPLKGAATVGLHVFNMLDQDMPFPYNTNLVPAYYPAAATANMFLVGCGLAGLVVAGRRIRSHREGRPYFLIAITMLVFQLAMHMFFAVETRWGVPSLMVLYVFAVYLLVDWLPAAEPRQRITALLVAGAITAAAYPLSHWVRLQAPQIRAAMQLERDVTFIPGVTGSIVPGRPFVSSNLKNWTLHLSGVGADDEAILFAPRQGEISGLIHAVTLEKNTVYQVEFDAQAVAAITSELSVDLYAGGTYDRGEQNSTFQAFERTYTHFKARWNSGPDAPREASLRFVTMSTNPIQIKNVVFSAIPQK